RSPTDFSSRTVATTASPRDKTSVVRALPNPCEAPVISQLNGREPPSTVMSLSFMVRTLKVRAHSNASRSARVRGGDLDRAVAGERLCLGYRGLDAVVEAERRVRVPSVGRRPVRHDDQGSA